MTNCSRSISTDSTVTRTPTRPDLRGLLIVSKWIVDGARSAGHRYCMGSKRSGGDVRRRVLVPQALGSDEFLRVTWHESREVMVFSHWDGDHCVAATPVRVADIAELVALTASALASSSSAGPPAWPAPSPSDLVVPAAGLWVTAPGRCSA